MDKRSASGGSDFGRIRRHHFQFKKSLGQNFLTDANVLRNIVEAAELTQDSLILEIGPGAGALTRYLAEAAQKVVAIEIDCRLRPILEEALAGYGNVAIRFGDVLKIDLPKVLREEFPAGRSVTVVANLPYYVTTPILIRLLTGDLPLLRMVVMVQKEVADRLQAVPGTKDYGSLSIAVQYHAEVRVVATVPKTVFVPRPNVDSAVVRFDLRPEPAVHVDDERFFFKVVRTAFAHRRKTLINNLVPALFTREHKDELLKVLTDAGIDPRRRGETLTIKEFAVLSNRLGQFMCR
ncbi:MAG: 16S rRNA (adenine(1518)-N(6)/adenine(1519)-N(6))-dimethyltransferase RsmA [Sporolactobacillus sp.]|jgi:16S rRNA (adenine1518-N6/adenine1519-N6)-dimethyltransferase|nr:16S rRNA (adenine(1518)-N(6)/adenine(1519)-N(6))-dimethyltransferase RsmA [Sporolactobacillus sp.]